MTAPRPGYAPRPLVLVIAACIVAAGFLADHFTPRQAAPFAQGGARLDWLVPDSFKGWQRVDHMMPIQPLPDDALADTLYDRTVLRSFRGPDGALVMLVLAYGRRQSDRLQVHRPEVCYVAAGFSLANRHVRPFRLSVAGGTRPVLVPATRLETRRGPRMEPVTYWMRIGGGIPGGTLARQWEKLRYGLSGVIPDGLLIRVSSLHRDPARAFETHDRFLRDLLTTLPDGTLPLFLGDLDRLESARPGTGRPPAGKAARLSL